MTKCPHCCAGRWKATDGRTCPTCEGAGVISPERLDQLLSKARFERQHAKGEQGKAVREAQRLRAIVEDELGAGSARRELVGVIEHLKTIIRQMGARIEELRAGGDDIHAEIKCRLEDIRGTKWPPPRGAIDALRNMPPPPQSDPRTSAEAEHRKAWEGQVTVAYARGWNAMVDHFLGELCDEQAWARRRRTT